MLDFDALNAYLDNDKEVIFAVLSVYQEDHGNSLEEIQELVQQQDWGKLHFTVHTIIKIQRLRCTKRKEPTRRPVSDNIFKKCSTLNRYSGTNSYMYQILSRYFNVKKSMKVDASFFILHARIQDFQV